ncbi:TonB-dependent receptor [Flavobacterium tibetense]|uniref:TonB-dependent receptor n=1 Tax=Flavobacterium tibetense TaxID=2233533 RepID=A0A365P4G0_9FLAO|nr:TonB-dependent receptor [Flavobacterium tibetense]RBA29475.1 TonB-dependent receptor [Flavobacterium tibetense]
MKNFLLLIVMLTFNLFATAQKTTGIISGKITDSETNFSLPGATIRLEGGNKYTYSNQNGEFEFLNIPEGNYQVEITYIGYEKQTQEVKVEAGKNTNITFALTTTTNELETVVVIGDRLRGQAKAINKQKSNQNITNVISSDQTGRFPDANIGDALKRVQGITMQNDQGEARNIIIRGLAPNLNSVTLNGDRIPSAEGDNRNVQMDLIPADMISTIEVNKTLTSDMDADAIGGSVNLITRATPNGERISATLAGGYGPIREKGNYTAGFVYGNRYLDNKLGVVFSASYFNNVFGSDNVEAVWVKDDFENVYIEEYDIRKYDVQRVRNSFAFATDYKFNNNNSIYLNAMYNLRDDRENRYRARYRGIDPIYDANDEIIGFEGDVRRQTKGGIDNNKNKKTRLERQIVQNYSIGGEHLLSSKLDMDWSINYAQASEDRPNERYIEFQNRGLDFDMNLNNTRFPLITGIGDNSAEDFEFRTLSENNDYTEESELGAKINFRVPFSIIENQKGRIRFGARLRIKDKFRNNKFFEYEPIVDFGNLNTLQTSFYGGENWQAGSQYVPGTFASNSFLGNLDLNNAALFNKEDIPSEYLALNYKAKENIYAGYVRFDQDFNDKLSMIAGLRLENTFIDYTANYIEDEEDLVGEINNTNSYTNVLPSIAFKYNSEKDWVYRAAFTTSIARPNYYALSPFLSVIPDDDSAIDAGNPNLKATYAYNFDLMLEKYYKSVGLLSGGVFYKKLNDFIYTYRDNQYTNAKFSQDFPNLVNPIPAVNPGNWSLTQERNGENVSVYGFEVAVQRQLDFIPGKFFKGLGVYLNYTFTDSEAKGITNADGEERKDVTLPGTAPHMFNSSLSWENKKFSARISLNYAADYLDELGGDSFDDRFYDKQTFIDANASYKFTSKLRVFAEANNLTNQPLRYYQGVAARTMQMEYYQARFNLGLKFDF